MNRPEQRLQRDIIDWWGYAHNGFKVDECALIHCPNGGRRSKIEAAIFKGLGVRPGVPDLLLFEPRKFSGLAIELKSDVGKVLLDQTMMLRLFQKWGWQTAICRTFDDSIRTITNYLELR